MKNFYKLFYFCLIIISTSCRTINREFEVLSVAVNQNYNKQECDSMDLLKNTFKINNSFLKSYLTEKADMEKGMISTSHVFNWIDKNEKWILSSTDISFFEKEIQKVNSFKIDIKKIKNDNIKIFLVNETRYNDAIALNKEITKRITNCRFFYQYSTPIFNKENTISILSRKEVLLNQINYFIYKKVDKNWKLIGFTQLYSE